MKKHPVLFKLFCAACILSMSLSAAACSDSNTSSSSKSPEVTVAADGYQLPYEYNDGYEAKLNTIDDSYYVTTATNINGSNKTVHFKTTKTEDEVKKYYNDYFETLIPVVPQNENDDSKGYYDSEKRLIVYNLVVWTADGMTNYKMGTKPCDDIESDDVWKVADKNDNSSDDADKSESSKAELNSGEEPKE